MGAQAGLANNIGSLPPEFSGDVRYVARQPILDLQGRVHGYDLLFRNAPEVILRRDAELAMQTMLDNEVIFGLERLTNGLPAFISCTAEALTENSVLVLSPAVAVLSVPASLDAEPRLVHACRDLKTRGFRLALDDFRRPRNRIRCWSKPIMCAWISRGFARRKGSNSVTWLRSRWLVAQKVVTYEDRRRACSLGLRCFRATISATPFC